MSLSGRVALITGATSGIGFHTAAGLARLGATVYITGRDAERGEEAERRLREGVFHERVHFLQADASTVGGNQRLAEQIQSRTDRLHILINNVGGAYNDRWETEDDFEATVAVQFVGPFALTEALMPLLQRSGPARIVNVVSAAIGMWKGDPFADLHATQSYLGSRAYARSKFLNILWTFALARRLDDGVTANAVDPGTAWTPMTAGIEPRGVPSWVTLIWPLFRWLQQRGTAEDAARSSIFLAAAPEAAGFNGSYIGPRCRPANPPASTLDEHLQERAWSVAAQLTAKAPTARSAHEAVI